MRQIKAPGPLQFDEQVPSVFLAGSIEQGIAENWQSRITDALGDLDITILNPRRDAWDAAWPQRIDFAPFRGQVEWELEAQEMANMIAFYFSPTTRSAITLLELGLAAGRGRSVVCCPEGFWRKGNIDIVCTRFAIAQVATLEEMVEYIRREARPN